MINSMRSMLVFVMMFVAGCAATPQGEVDPLSGMPADFCIDLTVLERPTVEFAEHAPPPPADASLRPSRYVLFADGSLHYAPNVPANRSANWLPPITRILSRAQTAETWSIVQQLGLANPQNSDPIVNFSTVSPQPGERIYLLDLAGSGKRWNFVRRSFIEQAPDPAIAQLIKHLAQLAWVDESEDANRLIMPKRYDFGPDPYAPYRKSK